MNISQKLSKIDHSFTVNIYDNGFMLEIGGRNAEDDWASAKIMCSTKDQLFDLINEIETMERE